MVYNNNNPQPTIASKSVVEITQHLESSSSATSPKSYIYNNDAQLFKKCCDEFVPTFAEKTRSVFSIWNTMTVVGICFSHGIFAIYQFVVFAVNILDLYVSVISPIGIDYVYETFAKRMYVNIICDHFQEQHEIPKRISYHWNFAKMRAIYKRY